MGEQRVTGVDEAAWPDVRDRAEPRPSRHLGRVVATVALVVIALAILFDSGAIGTRSTVVNVPSSDHTISYSFTSTCGSPPVGIEIRQGSRYRFLSPVREAGMPMPRGHRLRIRHRWFQGTDYSFIADDGRSVALEEFDQRSEPSCP